MIAINIFISIVYTKHYIRWEPVGVGIDMSGHDVTMYANISVGVAICGNGLMVGGGGPWPYS